MKNPETIVLTPRSLHKLKFDSQGLIPAIIQDYQTHEVLMLAYVNLESIKRTIKTGKVTYWSRSRQQYWVKGETSGHFQYPQEIRYDCDLDTLLIKVQQIGSACHTMKGSCFYRKLKIIPRGPWDAGALGHHDDPRKKSA